MKTLFIACMALFFATALHAQTTTQAPEPTTLTEKKMQEKTPVKVDELPEAVKAAIAGDDYKGWEVKTVFVIKGAKDIYEVNFVKGQETTTANFDKDGKKLA